MILRLKLSSLIVFAVGMNVVPQSEGYIDLVILSKVNFYFYTQIQKYSLSIYTKIDRGINRFNVENTVHRLHLLVLGLIGASFNLTYSNFASAEDSVNTVEEVVVIARKRYENLQEIPDSVTVINQATIERSGIRNISDIAAMTPNFSSYGNFRPNLSNISIRGLTSTQLGEPPIAFVVDGITVPNLEFINQGLVDIQQVEVIRGPQGALYGKNAIGGAVNITTKPPSEEMVLVVRAAIGEGGDRRVNASVAGSLGDSAVFRLGAFWRDFDGLIDDDFTGRESDYVDEVGFQGLIGFQLSERTYLDFRTRYSEGDYGLGYYENVDFGTIDSESIGPAHNVLPEDENELTNFSAKLEHETDAGLFLFTVGYNKSDDENFLDSDYSALPPDTANFFFTGAQVSVIEDKAITLETRFTSPSDQSVRWLAGVYYQDRERDNDFDIIDDLVGTIVRNRASLANELVSVIVRDRQESQAFAVFGQTNIDLTEDLELTLALRYDEEEREGLDPRDPTSRESQTFDEWQPKVSLAWQANENVLVYGTFASGFRSGGFNEVAGGVTRSFEAETSDTFEAGIKSTIVEGVFGVNAATFTTAQDNAQFTRFNTLTFSLEQLSIAEVEVTGIELESWWQATEALSINLGFGVIDSNIDSFDPAAFDAPPVGIEDNSMPRVADWNANLTITHTAQISDGLDLVTRVSGNWLGERHFDLENTMTDDDAMYLNASVGLEAEMWTLQLRGSNLTDDLEPEDVFIGITSTLARFRNQPRQILAEFTYRIK